MKLNKIDEVWNSANSLFEWRFRFVVIQKFILPWQRDVTTSLLYVPCFWIKSYYNFEQHTSCITYVCNTCLVLSLNSVLPSVLPPRRHGLLSETRNEGFSRLPFVLTQVLVRNCSTRYEFLTTGSRWESRTAVPGIFCPPSVHPCVHSFCACMHACILRACIMILLEVPFSKEDPTPSVELPV